MYTSFSTLGHVPALNTDIDPSPGDAGRGTEPRLHPDHADSSHVVAKVWPDLTATEVRALLDRYDGLGGTTRLGEPSIRPLSAAAIVRAGGRTVFVKRHHRSVRTAADLGVEHDFIRHLAAGGLPTPVPVTARSGESAVEADWEGREWTYEVFPPADGTDRYRGRPTWSPFLHADDAAASGAALARFHLASAGFDRKRRDVGVLRSHLGIFGVAPDPIARIDEILPGLPGVAQYLRGRPWQEELRPHLVRHAAAQPLSSVLPPLWTHNDWHASNQFFDRNGVSSIIDFGLAERTTRIYDIGTALDRNTLQWVDLLSGSDTAYRLDLVERFLRGYVLVSPLTDEEKAALPAILPIIQADFALSGLEYYVTVLGDAEMAAWGYESFLIDHTAWFSTRAGEAYLAGVRAILERL